MENLEVIFARAKAVLGVNTNKQMCEILEIPYNTLTTWKERKKIPKGRLFEIANRLNVSIDYILGKEPSFPAIKKIIKDLKQSNPNRPYKDIDDIKQRLGIKTNLELAKLFGVELSEILNIKDKSNKLPLHYEQKARIVENLIYDLKITYGGMNMDEKWAVLNYDGNYKIFDGIKLEAINFIYNNNEFIKFIELFKKYGNNEILKQIKDNLLKIKEVMER